MIAYSRNPCPFCGDNRWKMYSHSNILGFEEETDPEFACIIDTQEDELADISVLVDECINCGVTVSVI